MGNVHRFIYNRFINERFNNPKYKLDYMEMQDPPENTMMHCGLSLHKGDFLNLFRNRMCSPNEKASNIRIYLQTKTDNG